ncbi:hypothetical protein [Bacillus sp. T33-2]|uniref:hypothetical protein n=1 Tax=Bacillus sp. T33-2 TaxID=2054168 RepID=UPI0015E1376A|nr:hypothetical protein [Bacillus sp. T33-2]
MKRHQIRLFIFCTPGVAVGTVVENMLISVISADTGRHSFPYDKEGSKEVN